MQLSRAELHAFCLCLAALNALSLQAIRSLSRLGWGGSVLDLFGISAIFWFALWALVKIAMEDGQRQPPRYSDWTVASLAVLGSLIPVFAGGAIALMAASAWMFLFSRSDRTIVRLAIVGLGLCAPLVWGPVLVHLLGEQVLFADAWFVSLLSGLDHSGNVVLNPETGIEMTIYQACSSVRNISQALLLVAVVTQLFEVRLNLAVAVTTTIAVLGMILVNGMRLTMIGLYPQYYETLHDGTGNVAVSWLSLIMLMVIVGLGVKRAARAGH